jgi:hypothetical protein
VIPEVALSLVYGFSRAGSEASSDSASGGWAALIALITIIPLSITAVASVIGMRRAGKAHVQAAQANQAVNNVAPGEPRILDLVREIRSSQETQGKDLKDLTSKIDTHLGWHAGHDSRPGV